MVSLGQLSTRRPTLQHQSLEQVVDKQCLRVILKREILQGWGGGWCLLAAFFLLHGVKNTPSSWLSCWSHASAMSEVSSVHASSRAGFPLCCSVVCWYLPMVPPALSLPPGQQCAGHSSTHRLGSQLWELLLCRSFRQAVRLRTPCTSMCITYNLGS